jgi:hypothetical protein
MQLVRLEQIGVEDSCTRNIRKAWMNLLQKEICASSARRCNSEMVYHRSGRHDCLMNAVLF